MLMMSNKMDKKACYCIDINGSQNFQFGVSHVRKSEFGIRNPEHGVWTTAQGIRNHSNDWNLESKFHLQRLESRIQDCPGFSYMGRLEAGSAERPLRVADQKPVAKLQEDVLKVKQTDLLNFIQRRLIPSLPPLNSDFCPHHL